MNTFLRLSSLLAVIACTGTTSFADTAAMTPEKNPASLEIDRLLTATFPANAPGAVVLIARDGAVTFRKAYGLADLELGVPMEAGHVFPICSLTKQFTAAAILQLAEAGRLKLSDELSRYVPDYPTGEAKVTLAQLLAHTAGIPSIEEQAEARKRWREDLTPEQLLDFTRGKPLAFAPGSDWKYSNSGYYLLGRVIEKVSGQSYADYVATQLFARAGMAHSYSPDANRIIPQRVRGYSRSGKTWSNAAYLSMTQPYSAGGLLATADDLLAWDQALQAGRIAAPALLRTAWEENHLPDGRATRYGFGWELGQLGTHAMIGHSGGMPGFSAFAARIPEANLYVVLLANADAPPTPLRALAAKLVRLALDETTDVAKTAAPAPQALEEYVGSYRIAPGATFIVTAKDNTLFGQLGPGRRPLAAEGIDEFTAGDMQFSFVRDAAHRIEKVLVVTEGPGPAMIWPKLAEPETKR